MRVGDFSLEVVPYDAGRIRETQDGYVLARPGQVYRIRLRNHGPLRAVVRIALDGHAITENGIVLDPAGTVDLERPTTKGEHGRFVVIREGSEAAFGPDGGRDNEALGLIDGEFKRELPSSDFSEEPLDDLIRSLRPHIVPDERSPVVSRSIVARSVQREFRDPTIDSAAGTGLTGHSDQGIRPVRVGRLEDEATVIRLRLVIASAEEIAKQTPAAPYAAPAPPRPAARP